MGTAVKGGKERRSIGRGAGKTTGLWEDHRVQEGVQVMIVGAHVIVYSQDATADCLFFRDVLGLASVDAGQGWLIFALPPAEAAVHPA